MKKLLASILAICLVLSTMGTIAFADDNAVVEVENYDELLDALANGQADTIVMKKDITAVVNESNGYGKTGINITEGDTLDGNGHTLHLEVLNGTWDSAITTIGGTIKNLTINNGFRGIFISHITGYSEPVIPVILENVIIDGTTYTISCDQGMNQTLTATNCTFNGWTSFAATLGKVTFVNCEFGEGNGYAFFRPYAETKLDSCDFESGYRVDTRADTDLVACTYDGELITSENINSLGLIYDNSKNLEVDDTAVVNKVAYIPGKGGYDTLEAALKAVEANDTVELLSNVTVDYDWDCRYNGAKFTVPVTIDGNNNTLTITGAVDDRNWNTVFRFEEDATVKNLIIDASEATAIQRGITSKGNITVENFTFIGNGTSARYGVIFGEGSGNNIGNITATITDSSFENCSYGVSDNRNDQDVKAVTVSKSNFTNANVLLSAYENVTVTENTVDGGYVRVKSYTQPNELKVTVQNNTLDADFANKNVVEAGKTIDVQDDMSIAAVAKCNDYYYSELSKAVEAANDGETITLLDDAELSGANIKKALTFNLANNTLTLDAKPVTNLAGITVAGIHVWDNVTFANGNVDVICNENIPNGVFYIGNSSNAVLEFSNVTLTADNTNGSTLFLACNPGLLKITDSVINAKNVPYFINGGDKGSAVISDSKINVSDSARGLLNINVDIDDSEFNISNLSNNAFRNVSGTITNTVIDADGYENGIKNDAGLALAIEGNSKVTLTGAAEGGYDLHLKNGATLTVEETSTLEADDVYVEADNAVSGDVVSKADKVYVQYKKVDLDANGKDNLEGADKYEIVLLGADEEKINELASADLTFDFDGTPVTGGAMDYSVVPAKGVTLTQIGNRFMFNYNGVDKYEESGVEIVIGTLTVNGYGSYTLATAAEDTNAVYATEIRDNIVEGFKYAAYLVINTDPITNDGMVGNITTGKIEVPTRELTVKVTFPNAVIDNKADYQNMKVEITGNIDGVNQTVTYDLGKGTGNNASYEVKENRLVLHEAYTVTVSGDGYRTARYTVTMTDDKTLNFWNNVMDNEMAIEDGATTGKVAKNFLAGDIVADNNINIYDLSAVVSYFTQDATKDAKYIKYDLNRDGVIDSKDVAYVLVSWGE